MGGECIRRTELCDGYDDCDNGEDEEFCDTIKPVQPPGPVVPPGPCQASEFQCVRDASCIPADLRCDSRPDCRDNSDEIDCPCSYCVASDIIT
ncbi:hypothetical protein HAZT_HAZT010232 [Hyalella azteca]|uniref:Uncharacterized protein n=1 Tax=Hyalella azteca TaxID=294128 RepID=A0A6A0HAD9_HYAAZ|nr:hypothetical protein HAZT_HAZT010232 [Hyalella azteca]